jgi:hypothetical protein
MRTDAEVVHRDGLEGRLFWGYASYVPSAIAVWADVRGERGHWVEVQPPVDPSASMSVAEKVFLLPVPPADGTLAAWQEKGFVRVHGGGKWSAIVTFERRPSLEEASALARSTWGDDAAWIARSCERNALGDWVEIFKDPREIPRRTRERGYCRTRVARMAAAMLLYSYALESSDPARARLAAAAARGLGWTASLVGDESTLDFRTQRRTSSCAPTCRPWPTPHGAEPASTRRSCACSRTSPAAPAAASPTAPPRRYRRAPLRAAVPSSSPIALRRARRRVRHRAEARPSHRMP